MSKARLSIFAVSILTILALAACQPLPTSDGTMSDAAAGGTIVPPAGEGEAADDGAISADDGSAVATIATRSLRVRQAPDETSEVVYGVSEGEEYSVLEISPDGGWVRLAIADAPDGGGWVAAGFVSILGELVGESEPAMSDAAPAEATAVPAEEVSAEATAEATAAAPEEAATAEATEEAIAEATPAATEEAAEEATEEATEEAAVEATPAATEEAAEEEVLAPPAAGLVRIVNTDGIRLRVREAASVDSAIVGYVYEGEEYGLVGQSEDGAWVQIAGATAEETDNPDGGWVSAEFVLIGQ